MPPASPPRYNGGCQAGHNVELPDGRRHTFSQFGAGTLAGADTYIGPHVIIDPFAMSREEKHLHDVFNINARSKQTIHPFCLISTVYHQILNRVKEQARGNNRHGSCGQGIGETRSYELKYGQDALRIADLAKFDVLQEKLYLMRIRSLEELANLDGGMNDETGRMAQSAFDNMSVYTAAEQLSGLVCPLPTSELGPLPDLPPHRHRHIRGCPGDPARSVLRLPPLHHLERLHRLRSAFNSTGSGHRSLRARRHSQLCYPPWRPAHYPPRTRETRKATTMMIRAILSIQWQSKLRQGPLDMVLAPICCTSRSSVPRSTAWS